MLFAKSIKYPNTFNLVSGKTDLDDKLTSINRCIGLTLTSAKGELIGDPDFGSRLYELLFNNYTESLNRQIKQEIIDTLNKYETRVTVLDTGINIIQNGDHSFNITIDYTVNNSSQSSSTTIYLEERDILG